MGTLNLETQSMNCTYGKQVISLSHRNQSSCYVLLTVETGSPVESTVLRMRSKDLAKAKASR